MKKFILIGVIGAILGSFGVAYASGIRLIQVPEYVQGYRTVDLLDYLATLKRESEAKQMNTVIPNTQKSVPTIDRTPKPYGTVSA